MNPVLWAEQWDACQGPFLGAARNPPASPHRLWRNQLLPWGQPPRWLLAPQLPAAGMVLRCHLQQLSHSAKQTQSEDAHHHRQQSVTSAGCSSAWARSPPRLVRAVGAPAPSTEGVQPREQPLRHQVPVPPCRGRHSQVTLFTNFLRYLPEADLELCPGTPAVTGSSVACP